MWQDTRQSHANRTTNAVPNLTFNIPCNIAPHGPEWPARGHPARGAD
ncbi:MAG: hypothetical protein AB7E29_10460 [Xanthobacter sp.]